MSRCTSPSACASDKRETRLLQQEDDALRRQRSVTLDHPLQIHAAQPLHHVVEASGVGHAEVEQLHGVRRLELRGRLRLAREALPQRLRIFCHADAASRTILTAAGRASS